MSLIKMIKNRKNRANIYNKESFWDEKAEEYDGNSVSMWANNNLNSLYHEEQKGVLNNYFKNLDNQDLIDIGCGTGRMSNYFSKKGARVKGIDFSSKSIEIARNNSPGNVVYEVQSIFDFNESLQYDKAFAWGVLAIASSNRDELTQALTNIHRGMKEGGKILLLEPVHKGFLHRVLNMSIDEFVSVMRETGFEVEEVKQMHFWPARILLSYFTVPMCITQPVYKLGQSLMKYIPNSGDYKLIYAKKK